MASRMSANESLEVQFMSPELYDFEESDEEDILGAETDSLPTSGRRSGVAGSFLSDDEEEQEEEVAEDEQTPESTEDDTSWYGSRRTAATRGTGSRKDSISFPFGEWKRQPIIREGTWYRLKPEVQSRGLTANPSVLNSFLTVFPDEVFSLMTDMTNKNYIRKSAMREKKRQEREGTTCRRRSHNAPFTNITIAEMKAFVGINLAMGVVNIPRLELYWRKSPSICVVPFFRSAMSRDRFSVIYRHLHFSEPLTEEAVPSTIADETCASSSSQESRSLPDKLRKIRTFIEILRKRFRKAYVPGRELSIDESMIPFKGKVAWLQFIPSKRTRYGIKVFVLAEAKTGYMSNFSIYVGAEQRDKRYEHLGLSGQVVMKLLEPYLGEGRHVYMDNYFTSPFLFEELYSRNTYCCGTVRSYRKGFPKDLLVAMTGRGKKDRGYMDWRTSKSVLCYAWNDNRVVYIMTTIHHPDPQGTNSIQVKRRKRRRDDSGLIPCPQVVKDYNQYMGGVDFCDQLRKYYNITRKSKIWYKKVYGYFLECAVQNARVIYESLLKEKVDPIKFREELVFALVGDNRSGGDYRFSFKVIPSEEKRLDPSLFHLPVATEDDKIKYCHCCKAMSKAAAAAGRQKIKVLQTSYQCRDCEAPLCIKKDRNCFKMWHEEQELKPKF